MTKDFFTDSGITYNVFVVRGVALASATLKQATYQLFCPFLPAGRHVFLEILPF
jgi:hypothetical protein